MLEGVVEISTFYRYGVCICTSADIRSQTSRAMDLVIYNSGVAFCQTTSSTGQTCTTLAGVYSGDPLMWQLIWLKANQWMPNDWMAVNVMDEYSNGVVLCGGNGWNNQFNQNGCNYPSADAFIVGYSYGGISFPSTPYYTPIQLDTIS